MRMLRCNKRKVFYSDRLSTKLVPILDANGFETGEYRHAESSIKSLYCRVSQVVGEISMEVFGQYRDYDCSLTFSRSAITEPISDKAVFWIDVNTEQPHDYVVKRISKNVNQIFVMLRRIENGETR